jgi:hypothetical protein
MKRPLMPDMQVIRGSVVQLLWPRITLHIKHYAARRAQVIEDHPHNADERTAGELHDMQAREILSTIASHRLGAPSNGAAELAQLVALNASKSPCQTSSQSLP